MRDTRLFPYLIFAVFCLFIISTHTYHFSGRNYRQDEAWRAHLALERDISGTVQWALGNVHPPLWQLGLDVWVGAFGHVEQVTRFLSTLFTALVLALTYRLGCDLFDARTALLAVFILGSLAFFQFYIHETRPYALLALTTLAAQSALLRWLHRPGLRYALMFVLAGIAAIYTHFFALIFLAALALYVVLFVHWRLYARAFGLFAAVGLAFLGWLPSFLHSFLVVRPGGIDYALEPTAETLWDNLVFLYRQMNIRPVALGELILLLGLIVPFAPAQGHPAFRFGRAWTRLHIIAVPLLLLLIAFTANTFISSLTPRNLVVMLPSLALLAAVGLRVLPWQAQAVVVVLIAVPFVTNFRSYIANGPYREMVAFIAPEYQPGDPVIIDAVFPWQHVPTTYYVRERMPVRVANETLFHLMSIDNPAVIRNMPAPPVHIAADAGAVGDFSAFVGEAAQVWYIEVEGGTDFQAPYREVIDAAYIAINQADWGIRSGEYTPHIITQYRRVPSDLATVFVFGADIHLQAWELRGSVEVQPCQPVTLESWWRAEAVPDENYNIALVLADGAGVGIARSDGIPAGVLMQQWQADRPYLDSRTLTIPCDAAPGDYPLLISLYNFETQAALSATLPDGAAVGDLVYLTTLTVR